MAPLAFLTITQPDLSNEDVKFSQSIPRPEGLYVRTH
jgi:hypothetical protein